MSSRSENRLMNATDQALMELLAPKPVGTDLISQYSLFYVKILFRKVLSLFKINGAPKEWCTEFMLETLLKRGYFGIAQTTQYGLVPVQGNAWGKNIFENPIRLIVTEAPTEGQQISHEYTIGVDCTLIHLDYTYTGILDIIGVYATKLAMCDAGIEVNIQNCKVAYIFECEDESQEKTAKAMYDNISSGEPAVFTRAKRKQDAMSVSDGGVKMTINNVKNTFVANLIQDQKKAIMYEFESLIGLNNANVDKAERVNTMEVSANNDEIRNSVEDWKNNIEEGFRQTNELFGTNLSLEMPFYKKPDKGEKNVEESANNKSMGHDSN